VTTDSARIASMADAEPTSTEAVTPAPADASEDDRRAAAAAVNRERAAKEWEENKKRWRAMGVPNPLPAKK
jgi:hypothetical protein